jgi:putative ABC transport system permease protein
VIAQAAMSLVLLSAAALLGQSLRNLQHQDFGFETDGRFIAWINPMLANYKPEELLPLFRRINDRLRQIPGVRMVAPALYAPMTGDSWNNGIRVEGRPEPPAKEDTGAGFVRVMPDFFESIGAKIVLGRPITEEDTETTRSATASICLWERNKCPTTSSYSQLYNAQGLRLNLEVLRRHALPAVTRGRAQRNRI